VTGRGEGVLRVTGSGEGGLRDPNSNYLTVIMVALVLTNI